MPEGCDEISPIFLQNFTNNGITGSDVTRGGAMGHLQPQDKTAEHYRVFHGLGQAKFAYGSFILGSSHFILLPQLPLKMMLVIKVDKIDSKIIISLH